MYKNDIFNTTMGKVKDIKNLKKAIEFYLELIVIVLFLEMW